MHSEGVIGLELLSTAAGLVATGFQKQSLALNIAAETHPCF